MGPLWLQAVGGRKGKAAPGGCPWHWQDQTLPEHTNTTPRDVKMSNRQVFGSKHPAQDLIPPPLALLLLSSRMGVAMLVCLGKKFQHEKH